MRVELGVEVLSHRQRDDLALLGIFAFGMMGRHRVLIDHRTSLTQWPPMADPDLLEAVGLALEEGERLEAVGHPAEMTVRVGIGPPVWGPVPTLPAGDVLSLMARPLRVVMENGKYDRVFVLAFADDATRNAIEHAERNGWLLFVTAGGIEALVDMLHELDQPDEIARSLFLCDSDATSPGNASPKAVAAQRRLRRLEASRGLRAGTLGTVLAAREAENYIPPPEFSRWATATTGEHALHEAVVRDRRGVTIGPGAEGSDRRLVLGAIALNELIGKGDVLAHLDMKFGREHKGNVCTADAVWDQLDDFQRAALQNGFGPRRLREFLAQARGLNHTEIRTFVRNILGRM